MSASITSTHNKVPARTDRAKPCGLTAYAARRTATSGTRPLPPGERTLPQHKWTSSLLPAKALDAYAALIVDGEAFTPLETWGDTTLGMVTGNNR